MSQIELSQLWRYPVKSMRGAQHQELAIGPRGFSYDRHWMLTDEQGRFLTQRELPQMVLIRTQVIGEQLQLEIPGQAPYLMPNHDDKERVVTVWGDQCKARRADAQADAMLSEFLQRPCSLVSLPQNEKRQVDLRFAQEGDEVGFADGFAFLLISEASLESFNCHLDTPVKMERFRPNIVVSGCEAFAEDQWKRIRIGEIEFEVCKPCSRCGIPGIDPDTAEKNKFVLTNLAEHNKRGNKTYFGQNLIHRQTGDLQQGMQVEVLA